MPISIAGCGTDRARLLAAVDTRSGAEIAAAAAAEAARLPDQPDDCRKRERSGVREGDRLDAALFRTDAALGRANDRVTRCAAWYDDLRASRAQ